MKISRILQAALVLLSCGLAAAAPSIGSRAPGFSLPPASGGPPVTLANELSRHRFTVLMFIATRCPYSNGYNGRMERLSADYASRGIAFIGINSNEGEPAAAVVAHAREHGLTFPILKDGGSKTADLYGAQKTPEIFVLDAAGILRYHGRIDENAQDPSAVRSPDLRNALDAMLADRPVPAAETKAFGCSIKRP